MTTHSSLRTTLESILKRAHDLRIASSLSLFVGFGDKSKESIIVHAPSSNDKTIYDLASLTKIIGTTTAIAQAVDDGVMSLDDTPFLWWPGITIAMLLAHKTSLPAHRKFYQEFSLQPHNFSRNKQRILDEIFSTKITSTNVRVYSDLGFIALGWLLEQRLKKPLFAIFQDVWMSFAINNGFTWFSSQPPCFLSERTDVIPTGFCSYRQHRIHAQVHDPNCYYMGGLAGHAGLFGTLTDVAHVGRFFLSAVTSRYDTHKLIASMAHQGLGFDKPTQRGTTRNLSARAFGHYGYTGTSLWVDPSFDHNQGVVIALLTNRVHLSASPAGIFWLRLAVNQAISRADLWQPQINSKAIKLGYP